MNIKTKHAAGILVLGLSLTTSASLIWTIEQVGSDVVISTEGGTLDVSGLTKSTHTFGEGDYTSFYGAWARVNTLDPNGSGSVQLDYYAISQWSFSKDWSSYYQGYADSATGENYWFQDNMLCIPLNYVSGTALGAAAITFNNTTLDNMNLQEGESASWTWAEDSMTVVVGAVPEPATFGLMSFVSALCFFIRRRLS
ncbi:MAG: PEP-CTERM sorting domain-containing protein [Kiritimatiellales bacterium]|nr:PEP-CTERM sorting domain-containing protein [Kiritimatiellales bacterium]